MRAALAAALATGFLLVAAGCGSSTAAPGSSGHDAAALVPPTALAFVSVDTNLDSSQWKAVDDLTGALASLQKGLSEHKLDLDRDVRPALGDELGLAVLGVENGKPEVIALTQPKDESRLSALAARFDQGSEPYTVQQIGGWSVVADSAQSFQAARDASSGRSLADLADFKTAMSQLSGNALATAYAAGAGAAQLPSKLAALVRVAGSPRWAAAKLAADKNGVQLDVRAAAAPSPPYKPTLLRDVPSGAIAAVSFKDVNQLLARLASEPALATSLKSVESATGLRVADLRALTGEGVFSVSPGTLIPVVTLELQPRNPDAAGKTLRAVAAKAARTLPLRVERRGAKVLLTNAAAGFRLGGRSLVDDQQFKDALAAAEVPDEVTWLAYADVQRLLPIVQALAALRGGGQNKPSTNPRLDKLGTVVAFGARSGSTGRLVLRLGSR